VQDYIIMNRAFRHSIYPALAALLLLSQPAAGQPRVPAKEHRTVVIATGEWPPYVEAKAPHHGVLAHAVKEIFGDAGYRVKFDFEPWKRAKQEVREGRQDVLMPAYCSPERQQAYLCSKAVVTGRMVLFHRSDMAFHWRTIDDLKGYSIGATLGYYYGSAFDRAERQGKLNVVRIPSDETNMRLLMKGRIQLYPQDEAVGYAMIRQMFPRSKWHLITADPHALHKAPLHLLFTRQDPRGERLRRVFDTGLVRFRHDGRLGTLLDELHHPRKLMTDMPGEAKPPKARP